MLLSDTALQSNRSFASMGGKAAAASMTEEQKIQRARLGGHGAAARMTPEQRSERARKAALARFGKQKIPQAS